MTNWAARMPPGALVSRFGVHGFDMWHFLLQREVDEIVASRSAEDSTIAVTARLPGDVLASSTFSEGEVGGAAGGVA